MTTRLGSLLAGALALSLGVAAVPGCSSDDTEIPIPPEEPTFSKSIVDELDATLLEMQDLLHVRSIMAGIFVPGAGQWQRSVGFADADLARAQTGAHHVRIGSITKTFTATMILQLVDRGVMNLDDPISKWVPEVGLGGAATLRQLANMTSGYASYTFDAGFQDALFGDPSRRWAPAEVIAIAEAVTARGCVEDRRMCFTPGTAWFYSNTNTVLLGMAIERATKKSYADNLRELVTEPLGLKHTFQPQGGALPRPFLRGWSFQGLPDGATSPQEATHWDPSWGWGVGDLVSTFDDLRVWAKALGSGALLSKETHAKRLERVTFPPNEPDHAYAVGIGYTNGWWGHGGELPGYNTVVYYRPDVDASLVVSVNQDELLLDGKPVHPAYVVADAIIRIANREAPLDKAPADDKPGSE